MKKSKNNNYKPKKVILQEAYILEDLLRTKVPSDIVDKIEYKYGVSGSVRMILNPFCTYDHSIVIITFRQTKLEGIIKTIEIREFDNSVIKPRYKIPKYATDISLAEHVSRFIIENEFEYDRIHRLIDVLIPKLREEKSKLDPDKDSDYYNLVCDLLHYCIREIRYYNNVYSGKCGYYSVCTSAQPGCTCPPKAKVSEGFDINEYDRLVKEMGLYSDGK